MKLVFVTNHCFSNESLYGTTVDGLADVTPQINQWAQGFIKGRPQATEAKTVEELEAQGIVGLYKQEES